MVNMVIRILIMDSNEKLRYIQANTNLYKPGLKQSLVHVLEVHYVKVHYVKVHYVEVHYVEVHYVEVH